MNNKLSKIGKIPIQYNVFGNARCIPQNSQNSVIFHFHSNFRNLLDFFPKLFPIFPTFDGTDSVLNIKAVCSNIS
jgi:hypothetical protein